VKITGGNLSENGSFRSVRMTNAGVIQINPF
jgi:hypothetical protein